MNTISWLIPTYNEEQTIRQVIEQIPVGVPYVLDKSSDRTAEVAAEAGAKVVSRKGLGKGEAVREGFELLIPVSDTIVIIDGDNTYSPAEVFQLLNEIKNGADMAIGSRFLGSMENGAMSRLHRWGNKFLTFVFNRRFNSSTSDPNSGFRAIRVSALEKIDLDSKGFEIEVELTAKFLKNNRDVVEKPISYRTRPENSKGKLKVFRDGYRILSTILKS